MIGRYRDEGVERLVVSLDPAQQRLGQLDRTEITALEPGGQLRQRLPVEVRNHYSITFGTR